MMRRSMIALIALAAIVVGAAAFRLTRHEPEWTTTSTAALKEMRQGLEAEQKFYKADATKHYERALELDPGFVAARLRLMDGVPKEKRQKFAEELKQVDTRKLNDRERFFVQLVLARTGDPARARQIVDSFIDAHPDDAWGLWARCSDAWEKHDYPRAKQCYERMLKVAPNWVLAQNNLGYLEMAQGHFAEAENAFRTYRYIAPDQANPHDSLGELLTLRGRYEEADKELREAVRVRSDFCSSWEHLVDLELLRADYAKADEVATEAGKIKGCNPDIVTMTRARIAIWRFADARRASEILAIPEEQLPQKRNDIRIIRHAAAIEAGDIATALSIENETDSYASKHVPERFDPGLAYLQARRLASQSDYAAAIDLLRRADSAMGYWGEGDGIFKLAIKSLLAQTLRKSGDTAAGDALFREVDKVNPQLGARFKGSLLEMR